ncbi:MAG: TylF/MycF/NovP-related O-methyltransferase [Chitinophagales bacterium]
MIKEGLLKFIGKLGYTITKNKSSVAGDFSADNSFSEILNACRDYSMTSIERMYALYQAVHFVEKNDVEGDIVECGVWKGGSSMLAALSLKSLNSFNRHLFLYDTFEGMSNPSDLDISVDGDKPAEHWEKISKDDKIFCYSSIDEVKVNLAKTSYPQTNIHFIKGKVEDTIPGTLPQKISILRLDTDWFESTYHELKYLFPLLSKNGILIIDDYGHWKGARTAVDSYFKEMNIYPLLQRTDYTGRMMVKI